MFVVSKQLATFAKKKIMAITIKNIPVLTGKDAEYFNRIVEDTKSMPFTHIPEKMKAAFKAMEERSRNFVVKK